MNETVDPGAEAVASALEAFAQMIGISADDLANFDALECEHLLRKLLACQTSDKRASPQKVLALLAHDEVDRIEFESNGEAWKLAETTPFEPDFYTYVASRAELSHVLRKNPTFRRFAKHLNQGLGHGAQMNDHEVWLMYHLLNALDTNARQVLTKHFQGDMAEVNRVHNAMLRFSEQEHQSERGTSQAHREHTGEAIAAAIEGASFPMFARGDVYIGAMAEGDRTRPVGAGAVDDETPQTLGQFALTFDDLGQGRTWSPEAEVALRSNPALECFRAHNQLPVAFSRRTLWKQAIVAAVVPKERRSIVAKDTMDTLIGRKQYADQTWDSASEWLQDMTYEWWDSLWNDLAPHFDAHAVLTSNDRAKNQTQTLYNALCTELTPGSVRERYAPVDLLRLMVTAHLPDQHQGRLLKPEELGSRATLRALNTYHERCPYVGRAILMALCDA